eukprot:4996226-Pleurochrysis_carterae.AAC.1
MMCTALMGGRETGYTSRWQITIQTQQPLHTQDAALPSHHRRGGTSQHTYQQRLAHTIELE